MAIQNTKDAIDKIKEQIDQLCVEARLEIREEASGIIDQPALTYDEKNNLITLEISETGDYLLKKGMFNVLEKFWTNITIEIDALNENRVNKLNRGIPLANAGVSQIIQTKIKEGIFNLYRALVDDEGILKKLNLDSNPEKNLVNTSLFLQFEEPLFEKVRTDILSPNAVKENEVPSAEALREFLKKQDPDKRLFLFEVLSQLFSSVRKNKILPNMMSRQQIVRSLADLCLYLEDSLRKKNKRINGLYQGLNFLKLPDFKDDSTSTDLDSLLKKISQVKDNEDINKKRALISVLLRNFSAHNLETNEHIFFRDINVIYSYIADVFFTLLLCDIEGKI